MTLVPFECIWRDDHILTYQTNGVTQYPHGIYNVISKEICEKCGNPYLLKISGVPHCFENYIHDQFKDVDRTFQLGRYFKKSIVPPNSDDVLSKDILALKKDLDYAQPLAKSMFLVMEKNFPLLLEADAIVPVPNHPEDYHSTAKAVALANELQVQFTKHAKSIQVLPALKKVKNISTHGLSRADREIAVDGMFEIDTKIPVLKKKIILVDDVLTAGNIKGKCATILKQNGAEKVWVYVAGRTI